MCWKLRLVSPLMPAVNYLSLTLCDRSWQAYSIRSIYGNFFLTNPSGTEDKEHSRAGLCCGTRHWTDDFAICTCSTWLLQSFLTGILFISPLRSLNFLHPPSISQSSKSCSKRIFYAGKGVLAVSDGHVQGKPSEPFVRFWLRDMYFLTLCGSYLLCNQFPLREKKNNSWN